MRCLMSGWVKKIAKLKNLIRIAFRSLITFRFQMKLLSLLLPGRRKRNNGAFLWLKHLDSPELYSEKVSDMPHLFKKYVNIVHLEISSYCNRSCLYCPNSKIPHARKQKKLLPETLFLKCLQELAAIRYDQYIEFNGFNEPLFDEEIFFSRVKAVKEFLPESHLVINTNGDCLTEEYLKRIAAADVQTLLITLHLVPEEFSLTPEERQRKIRKFLDRFPGVRFELDGENGFLPLGSTKIFFRLSEFNEKGHNWGGAVGKLELRRVIPCFVPAKHIYVDYSGRVNLCCSVNMDYAGMEDFCIGNIEDSSLWELYASPKSAKIRKSLVDMQNIPECCKYCNAQTWYFFHPEVIENPYFPYQFRNGIPH